jgi:hypothetical protein
MKLKYFSDCGSTYIMLEFMGSVLKFMQSTEKKL